MRICIFYYFSHREFLLTGCGTSHFTEMFRFNENEYLPYVHELKRTLNPLNPEENPSSHDIKGSETFEGTFV